MKYSDKTNSLLISMIDGSSIDLNQLDFDVANRLFEDEIVCPSGRKDKKFRLSDAGRAYVESLLQAENDKKYGRFRDNVNLLLAICGILLSIVAIIISIVKP